jgi:CheY-like chemotaxis protein
MPAPLDKVDLSQLDVLLIDDNKFIRLLLGDVLRSFGVGTVREASSADQALLKINQRRPDIILCDWMMAPLDGIALLRKIRSAGTAQRVPVIMITGHATSDHVSEALGEGADSYIVKPFRPATLVEHLLKVICASNVEYL